MFLLVRILTDFTKIFLQKIAAVCKNSTRPCNDRQAGWTRRMYGTVFEKHQCGLWNNCSRDRCLEEGELLNEEIPENCSHHSHSRSYAFSCGLPLAA